MVHTQLPGQCHYAFADAALLVAAVMAMATAMPPLSAAGPLQPALQTLHLERQGGATSE